MKKTYIVRDQGTKGEALNTIVTLPIHDHGWKVVISPVDRRTLEQNDRMWAMLQDISNQVLHFGHRLSKEDWKDLLTASLHRYRMVPELDGPGMVMCGMHTSSMSKKEMSELIDRIEAFGGEHGVRFLCKE